MTYVEHVNRLIRDRFARAPGAVAFGQNITAGSCLGGLTRGLDSVEGLLALNTPNSENTLAGVGFGLMLGGVNSVFFMKQLDFLYLGMDHLVNTWNFLRLRGPAAGFTVFPIVVDVGFQGMQSSANDLAGLCAAARVEGYAINGMRDAERIIGDRMLAPGFRVIAVSQRLFKAPIPDPGPPVRSGSAADWFQYAAGRDATIVCFNFSLPQGMALARALARRGRSASLFCVNAALAADWDAMLADLAQTRRLAILDDSKSFNSPSNMLLAAAARAGLADGSVACVRAFSESWYRPNSEEFDCDVESLADRILNAEAAR